MSHAYSSCSSSGTSPQPSTEFERHHATKMSIKLPTTVMWECMQELSGGFSSRVGRGITAPIKNSFTCNFFWQSTSYPKYIVSPPPPTRLSKSIPPQVPKMLYPENCLMGTHDSIDNDDPRDLSMEGLAHLVLHMQSGLLGCACCHHEPDIESTFRKEQ